MLATLLGVALGALIVGGLAWPVVARLQVDLREAHNRLYGAWQSGATIPAAPEAAEPVVVTPLPPELQELVDEWTSPDVRASVEDRIRRLQGRGLTPGEIGTRLRLDYDAQRLGFPAMSAK